MPPASGILRCGAERGPRRVSARALISDPGQSCAGGCGLLPSPPGRACPPPFGGWRSPCGAARLRSLVLDGPCAVG
eukprot:10171574-Alexandrium_andersonii.AAC.1